METTNAKSLEIVNVNIDIVSIDYKKRYEEANDNEVTIKQTVELKDYTFDVINLLITRSITFEPKSAFDLDLSALVTLYLDKDESIDFNGDKEKMRDYILSRLSVLAEKCCVGNVLSSMISQITGSCGNIPFVTPPNLNEADNQTHIG